MRRTILSLLLLCAAIARAEVDWTPRFTTATAEGAEIPRLYFAAGEKNYAVAFDRETSAEADREGARFTYTKVPSGVFTIQPQRPAVPLPADEKRIVEFRKLAVACTPENATDFQLIEEVADVLAINHWQSLRIVFTYNLYGHRRQHSVTFLTLADGQQARLETNALATEFAQAVARADYLIRSWHELDAADVVPAKS